MAKKKTSTQQLRGKEGFELYYHNIFKDRWADLKEALLRENQSVAWKTYAEGAIVWNECKKFLDFGEDFEEAFFVRKILRGHVLREIFRRELFQKKFFRDVLSNIAREDEKLLDTIALHNKLVEKYNNQQNHRRRRIDDPTDRIKQLAHRLPALRQRCAMVREKALKEILRYLDNKTVHEVSRLKGASDQMRKKLEWVLDNFKVEFENELKGPDSTTVYQNQHLR